MRANDLHNFSFKKISSGCYRVVYATEKRGDYWIANINDMTLIDATRNADWAKINDIKHLRNVVKMLGIHKNVYGKVLD